MTEPARSACPRARVTSDSTQSTISRAFFIFVTFLRGLLSQDSVLVQGFRRTCLAVQFETRFYSSSDLSYRLSSLGIPHGTFTASAAHPPKGGTQRPSFFQVPSASQMQGACSLHASLASVRPRAYSVDAGLFGRLVLIVPSHKTP